MNAQPITLTDEEIKDLTGYSRPAYQLRVLDEMHIPARRRPDNTVMVLRMHCTTLPAPAADERPKLNLSFK